MTNIQFKFDHGDHVIITIFGLNYEGRINRCIWDGGRQPIYSVNFASHGDCNNNEFYEDELRMKNEQ